ncbi:hypothetical protein M0813_29049 [Anaeramoeba flamelloides]|uniref:Uncharacterized protein n=1 Tax=Anaeramoeba flamelloides TaxID=1746091 RepID=A0ABQ8XSK8_9EUKA|nr:hypothetical protein M0813_29049 [Anaeramoeba flamelloides]
MKSLNKTKILIKLAKELYYQIWFRNKKEMESLSQELERCIINRNNSFDKMKEQRQENKDNSSIQHSLNFEDEEDEIKRIENEYENEKTFFEVFGKKKKVLSYLNSGYEKIIYLIGSQKNGYNHGLIKLFPSYLLLISVQSRICFGFNKLTKIISQSNNSILIQLLPKKRIIIQFELNSQLKQFHQNLEKFLSVIQKMNINKNSKVDKHKEYNDDEPRNKNIPILGINCWNIKLYDLKNNEINLKIYLSKKSCSFLKYNIKNDQIESIWERFSFYNQKKNHKEYELSNKILFFWNNLKNDTIFVKIFLSKEYFLKFKNVQELKQFTDLYKSHLQASKTEIEKQNFENKIEQININDEKLGKFNVSIINENNRKRACKSELKITTQKIIIKPNNLKNNKIINFKYSNQIKIKNSPLFIKECDLIISKDTKFRIRSSSLEEKYKLIRAVKLMKNKRINVVSNIIRMNTKNSNKEMNTNKKKRKKNEWQITYPEEKTIFLTGTIETLKDKFVLCQNRANGLNQSKNTVPQKYLNTRQIFHRCLYDNTQIILLFEYEWIIIKFNSLNENKQFVKQFRQMKNQYLKKLEIERKKKTFKIKASTNLKVEPYQEMDLYLDHTFTAFYPNYKEKKNNDQNKYINFFKVNNKKTKLKFENEKIMQFEYTQTFRTKYVLFTLIDPQRKDQFIKLWKSFTKK